MLSAASGSKEHGGRVRGVSSKLTIKHRFQNDRTRYRSHDRYKEEIREAAEKELHEKFKDLFIATLAEQQQSGLLWFNPSQEVGQQQMVMPPPVLGQVSMCAQSNDALTTAQSYPMDIITSTTPYLLLYPICRAGKTKEVAKAQVEPVGGLFEGKPIPPLYACIQVE
jgi:hypothetical protein